MTYLQASNRSGKRSSRVIFGICAALVVLFVLIRLIVPHLIPAIFTSIARPFWRMEYSVEAGSLSSPGALLAENEDLKRQLAANDVRLATIAGVEADNADLKVLLGRDPFASTTDASSTNPAIQQIVVPRTLPSRILAPVLVRPAPGAYDELIIDGGVDQGFTVGDNVYAPGPVLIGKVTDVLEQTSKVALLSSPGQKYDVLIGSSSAPASALGRGGGQYSAELPRSVIIAPGDMVIAPSLNDKAFGIVSSISNDPAQAFETILFAPPVNEYQLKWVLVDVKTKK